MTYNSENVRGGKLKSTGGVYTGPVSTAAPTDASTALPAGFKSLGLVGPDGVTSSPDKTVSEWRDQRGVVIRKFVTESKVTVKIPFIESSFEVLQAVYGAANVTKTATAIHVRHNASLPEPQAWAIELADGADARREYIPRGQVVSAPELTFNSEDPITYEVEIETMEDTGGDHMHTWIEVGGGVPAK